jgi:hypothetical protein
MSAPMIARPPEAHAREILRPRGEKRPEDQQRAGQHRQHRAQYARKDENRGAGQGNV